MFRIIAIAYAIFAVAYAYEDDHDDHWDDYDDYWHYHDDYWDDHDDHWDEDHEEDIGILGRLFEHEECLGSQMGIKWMNWVGANGIEVGLDDQSRDAMFYDCEHMCGSGNCHPHILDALNFTHDDLCDRLMHGDLNRPFEDELIHNPWADDRFALMSTMNILCGHVEIECAYTMSYKSDECHDQCNGQNWNDGLDNYYDACDFIENHWVHEDNWGDEQHWGNDLWTMLFEDNKCTEVKWALSNYRNGIYGFDEYDPSGQCESFCDPEECWHIDTSEFENEDSCFRLIHGDLKERFENEVINNHDSEERDYMMATMNVMCGNIPIECAYAMERQDHDGCFHYCDHWLWNHGHDEWEEACHVIQEDDDHWNDDHWDDDHWDDDHWEDDDHSDDENSPFILWEIIMRDNRCQEAKWILNNYKAGFTEGMEHMNQQELEWHCEEECGHTCYQLSADDFVNHEVCERLKYGDLRDDYERLVLDAREGDDREAMMSTMNVMCGNMELECAYAAFKHWETVQDGRNIFEKLAEAVETPEKKECNKKCKGQMWDKGFDDLVHPCSSLMHSLSFAIILIISLLR